MAINDFSSSEAGTIFNPIARPLETPTAQAGYVSLDYPSRLGAMTLDPSKITDNNNMVFPAGQISFCVGVYKHVEATLNDSGEITVADDTPRPAIVRHAGLIMKKALGFEEGVHLSVRPDRDLRHSGLGSSGSTLAGTAAAVNELFGNPLGALELARFCSHNYGEEIDEDKERLVSVQSIGGSAMCGLLRGGLLIVSGEAVPIYSAELDESLQVVIGVPSDYRPLDAEELIRAEVDNIKGFQDSGEKHAQEVAYRLVHKVLPGLVLGDVNPCKDLIFDFRWNMGSVRNCSFAYPGIVDLAESLRDLGEDERATIIAPSSVGPAFFSLTKDPEYITHRFSELDMKTFTTNIHNGRYIVQEKR